MALSLHKGATGEMAGARARALRLPGRRILAVAALATVLGAAGVTAGFVLREPAREASASELGAAYMDEGDYRRAAETLRAAYRINPSEETKVELARALLGSGDYAGVLELLKATDQPESEARYAYLRAEAMIRAERYDDARAVAAGLLASNPSDGRSMLISARALYGVGDRAQAAEFLGKALRARDGALGEAWLFRARMALDANDLEAVRGALARAKDAAVPARNLALFYGEALLRSGDLAAARASLPEPVKRKRSKKAPVIDAQREYALARIDAASGNYLTAARRIRLVKAALAGEPNGSLVAGLIQEGAGDAAQAENEFRSALALAPRDPALLDALAAMLTRAKRYDEALAMGARLQSAAPALGALRRMAVFDALGDHDSALAAAKRAAGAAIEPTAAAVALGSHSVAARKEAADLAPRLALARAAASIGEDRRSAAETARALAAPPAEPVALALAGDLYFASGDDEAAAESFDRALALAPRFRSALEGRVRADVRDGDLAGAQARLADVVASDAGNAAARIALARLLRKDNRILEASAMLSPVARELYERPRDALLYGDLLSAIGAVGELEDFARGARRASSTAPLARAILQRAGRLESASLAARDALLDDPNDEARAADYASLMAELGKTPEATAYLTALVQRRPDAAGAQLALQRLSAGEISRLAIRDDGSAPTIEEARRAYLNDPSDSLAASRFGRMLLASGAQEEGTRVLREACFFSLEGYCRDGAPRS